MAYAALACREPIENALKDTGMWKVYGEIELPLIFTLDSMEKTGIRVQGEELKAYGDKLLVRIQELEKEIYSQAGEEFNINSPKQLGVILFEKMGIPGGRKQRQDIPQQPIFWRSLHLIIPLWKIFWNTVSSVS